ncbi:efflux RND transporter periplasmic adaptor subunit [Actinomadura sp. HBU206391]|uniref:efflux RND transporter periplasmic adaptor subunit n=1 Tax=Actinomadura sp. HBU206391 TaxID=2731692 RepID=UPI00164FC319|nr:efflux RND transporter periplasmic adaptor subunit [Actinomadura sp. HBU206391]MBC6459852.1 efflux RND transporter periplasmic adaptor subunit [Actinomadura sp. HBU206391]
MSLRRFIPLAVVGVLIAGLISACSGDDKAAGIRLGAVTRADVAEVVEAPATVTARATATLRSPAEGTVRRLRVADGDEVRKGEVLARIASPTADEQLRQAREADSGVSGGGGGVPAGVDLSSFQRRTDRTARRGFTSARQVAMKIPDTRQRAVVLAQITRAQADYATAAAAARNALVQLDSGIGSVRQAMSSITAAQRVQTRAAVRAAERTVAGLTIKAPFAGVVSLGGPAGGAGDLSGLIGQLPAQAQAPAAGAAPSLGGGGGATRDAASVAEGVPIAPGDAVVTVTDVSRLGLSAEVDETDVLDVKRGTPATVEFDAVQGATYQARVTGVGVTPKESTGGGVTYRVTLSLRRGTTADGAVAPWPKPGMSAVVDLRVREVGSAVSVPSSAIVTSGRDSTVWVVSGGRAQRRVVRLGAQGDATVQVTSGLAEGERVVVRGVNAVKQNQKLPR